MRKNRKGRLQQPPPRPERERLRQHLKRRKTLVNCLCRYIFQAENGYFLSKFVKLFCFPFYYSIFLYQNIQNN